MCVCVGGGSEIWPFSELWLFFNTSLLALMVIGDDFVASVRITSEGHLGLSVETDRIILRNIILVINFNTSGWFVILYSTFPTYVTVTLN